jgi:uncharacterized delta-60 repeat protein
MKKITLISIVSFILFTNNIYCQDGSLDLTFNGTGKVTTGLGNSFEEGSNIAIQSDGKIIVSGSSQNGLQVDFALARYNTNGSLDTTFGTNGKVTTPIGNANDFSKSIAIQTDGKIVLVGSSYNGTNYDFAIARYNTNGTLDTSFDTDGKTTIAIGSSDDYGASVVIQTDGKIIVCGNSQMSTTIDFSIIRLNNNGSLDTTFDTDGKLTTSFSISNSYGASVGIQADGKIIAGGSIQGTTNIDFGMVRYNSNGSLDTTFDTDGKVTTDIGSASDIVTTIAIQTDGKILLGGNSVIGTFNVFALARFNTNGSLDTTFDTDGKTTTLFNDAISNSMKIQLDGKIVLAGTNSNGADTDIALARYNSNGSLDNTFDTDGKVTTAIGTTNDYGNAVTISPNDKILVAGQVYNESYDFALIRYNSNGSLDTSLDTDGKVITNFGNANSKCSSIALQTDGKIIMAGNSQNGTITEYSLTRYNSDGSLDATFDTDGKVITTIGFADDGGTSIAIQNDGKIVVAGFSYNGTNYDFALIRYNSNGSLDTSFDTDGKVTTDIGGYLDQILSLVIQPDGKILVAGVSGTINNNNFYFALARYNSNGGLDTTFDADGKVTTSIGVNAFINSIALQNDGKIVATGSSYNGSNYDFAIARYNSNGSLDTTFDTDGKVISAVGSSTDYSYSVVIQNDGKIVVAGSSYNGFSYDFALARYNNNGGLDTSFDTDGKVTTAIGGIDDYIYSIKIQSDGKIVAAGSSKNGAFYDYALARYNNNGSLDTTFDTDGKVTTNVSITASNDSGNCIAIQPDGKIVMGGTSWNGNNDEFSLVRYNNPSLGIEGTILQKNSILVYPNPFSDIITVTSNQIFSEASFTVYNNFGQIIKQINNVSGNDFDLNMNTTASGIYFLTIEEKGIKTTQKIIKK